MKVEQAMKKKKRLIQKKLTSIQWTKGKVLATVIAFVVTLAVIEVGVVVYKHYSMNHLIDMQQVEQQDASQQYQQKQAAIKKRQDRIKSKINDYIKAQQGAIGVSYYELNTQEGFDLNGNLQFSAGNMAALPISLMVAGKVDQHQLSWNKAVGNGKATVNQLMSAMIEQGSADARQQLTQAVGGTEALIQYMKANDKKSDLVGQSGEMTMSPQMAVHYLMTIEENKDNKDSYKRIQAYMAKNRGRVGLLYTDKTAGEVEQVYAKTADDNLNVAGMVDGKHPFVIAIFTKDQPKAKDCIEHIVNLAADS